MGRTAALLAALASIALTAPAAAQEALAEARAAFDRAEFEAAVAAFDRAADGAGLSREDVLTLLEGRAIAKHAARDVAGADADLTALLSLEPEHELGESAPPAVQRAFARLRGEIRGRLSIAVDASRIPDGFSIETRVIDDVASLVREVRVRWQHEGEWRSDTGRDVRVLAGSSLRYYVEAVGPGGAVLAREGSAEEPLSAGAIEAADPIEAPPSSSDDTALWVGLGIGAAVVVAAVAIVLAVVLGMPPRTQPTAPMELP